VTGHLTVLLEWTVVDFAFLGIGIQQYISITRDLKRTRETADAEKTSAEKTSAETGHPEGE
jgi:cell division protein FtsB